MLLALLAQLSLVQAAPPPWQDAWVQAPAARLQQQPGLGFVEESRPDGWWRVHATADALAVLEAEGWTWTPAAPLPPDLPDGYHSPEDMVAALWALADAHPALVQVVEVGMSREGRPLVGVRLSAVPADAAPRAQWRVLGAHHGDELPSGELALALAAMLAADYGLDPEVTALLDQDAVWVVPHINPDGVARVSRYNSDLVDLNRNYDYEWSAGSFQAGLAPFSEPETRAVRTLDTWNPILAGVSLHAGATNIGWVWNYTTTESPDDTLVATMADGYAAQCGTPGFWVTNGAAWYITHGDTTDWSYGRRGTLDFTVEVSTQKAPAFSEAEARIAEHLPAIRAFLLWPDILAGQVIDAESGRGIPATVVLRAEGQPLVTGPDGRFARIVAADGPWAVTVEAAGYEPAAATLEVGAALEIALTPSAARGLVGVTPSILSRGGDGTFQVDVRADTLTLQRPGEAPISAAALADGRWQVDVDALSPGPWDVIVDDGRQVSPRSLLVGEVDDQVQVRGVRIMGNTLTLSGDGFGAGARVWALWGEDRAPVSLEIQRITEDTLSADTAPLAGVREPVDLVLVSRGYQVVVRDALGVGAVDTAAPPHDVGETGGTLVVSVGGCAHTREIQDVRSLLIGAGALLGGGVLRRRRERRTA